MIRSAEYILSTIINFFIGLVEIALGLRFILKLFGANPGAPFVDWIYEVTLPLLYPFRGMLPSPALEQGFILEFSTLFAMIMYALIGWLLIALITFVTTSSREVDRTA